MMRWPPAQPVPAPPAGGREPEGLGGPPGFSWTSKSETTKAAAISRRGPHVTASRQHDNLLAGRAFDGDAAVKQIDANSPRSRRVTEGDREAAALLRPHHFGRSENDKQRHTHDDRHQATH